jgi:translation elongation factor EF-G
MQHCCHLIEYKYRFMVRVMVFNATFKKISVLSWTYVRCYQGGMKKGDTIYNTRTNKKMKVVRE